MHATYVGLAVVTTTADVRCRGKLRDIAGETRRHRPSTTRKHTGMLCSGDTTDRQVTALGPVFVSKPIRRKQKNWMYRTLRGIPDLRLIHIENDRAALGRLLA